MRPPWRYLRRVMAKTLGVSGVSNFLVVRQMRDWLRMKSWSVPEVPGVLTRRRSSSGVSW